MMSPRSNNDCYQPNYVTPWSSPADQGRMMHSMNVAISRRNSMQHVPFMDFSFFPVPEGGPDKQVSNAPPAPHANDLVTPHHQHHHHHHQPHVHHIDFIPIPVAQSHPIPFRPPPTSYDLVVDDHSAASGCSDAASPCSGGPPSLTGSTSIDSSEHSSVSSKSLLSESSSSTECKDNTNSSNSCDASGRFKPFHEEKWSLRYKELLEFHKSNGHSAVPHTYPKNPQLARWVKRQRRQYKLRKEGRPSTMTTERLELLDSVGFIWDSHDLNWREKLEALTKFRHEKGHCNVPSNFRDKKLATWVKCQRRQYKLYWDGKPSAMSLNRIVALEKVGFEWEIRAAGSSKSKQHTHDAVAAAASAPAAPISLDPSEGEPLPVHVPSTMGTGEQILLAKAIADL